ncbi:DUF99 family protein [Candidatus Woesearchaeota archaeon]|nr:DUF99 family protein [Candidatus Woesearchaeota archaeon]
MKKEIRLLGIDDGPFTIFGEGKVIVIGAIFRGGLWLDGILSTKVAADGDDATEKLARMINQCKFKPQLHCILLDGISLGGFNVVDIQKLSKQTKIPVIVVMRKFPRLGEIHTILERLGKKAKLKFLANAGPIVQVGEIFVQVFGLGIPEAKEILKVACTRSNIPEALRAAHMIASGVVRGESRGRA